MESSEVMWSLSGRARLPMQETAGPIPGLRRPPGRENGNPFQYSCWNNPMDRGTWWAAAHGVAVVGHDLATKPHHRHGEL